jgi:hypothetical protein
MMVNFSEVALHLAQSPLVQHSLKALEEAESELLFSIAYEKDRIYRAKKASVGNPKSVVIANPTNFGNIRNYNCYGNIKILSAESIRDSENDDDLLGNLENALVIMTSNIFADIGVERFSYLYCRLPKTIFAIHDYDNHHWIACGVQAAIFSDVYIPSHQSDNLIAARVNSNIVGGLPCGTNQFSFDFINRHAESLLSRPRDNSPLGKYYFYEKFAHRNKLISTLAESYPSISLINGDFHTLTQEQKWVEWSSHKLHWIIPTLNDLPIRFFDALITGGLPLIPGGLQPFVAALDIPDSFYLTYGPLDTINPKDFVSRANGVFDAEGEKGVIERHQYALKNFHVDAIIEKIISSVNRVYQIKL